jgi:hypothetical protein
MEISTFDIPASHYEAIGRVTTAWAMFETVLDISIWFLAKTDFEKGACLTAQISGSGRKLDAIISLTKLTIDQEATIKELNKIAEATRHLAEKRNRVVHDPWIGDNGKLLRLEATARKILRLRQVEVNDGDTLNLVAEINAHMYRYLELMRVHLPDLP